MFSVTATNQRRSNKIHKNLRNASIRPAQRSRFVCLCGKFGRFVTSGLVYDAPGEAGEAHWNEEAKALIAGIVLYIASEEPQERRTLATLREHLTAAPDAFSALLGPFPTVVTPAAI